MPESKSAPLDCFPTELQRAFATQMLVEALEAAEPHTARGASVVSWVGAAALGQTASTGMQRAADLARLARPHHHGLSLRRWRRQRRACCGVCWCQARLLPRQRPRPAVLRPLPAVLRRGRRRARFKAALLPIQPLASCAATADGTRGLAPVASLRCAIRLVPSGAHLGHRDALRQRADLARPLAARDRGQR